MNFMRNFNRLSNLTGKWQTRNISQTTVKYSANKNLIIEPLTEREVIRVKGDEVVPFIQGLITNDIKHLHPSSNKAIYAMFLNKAGRVLYDTIIYSTTEANKILIECDKNVANDLKRHLRLYRVRRNIDIDSMDDELKVWQIFNSNPGESKENLIQLANVTDITITTDPRLKDLGCRLLVNSGKTSNDLTNLFALQEGQMTSTYDNNFRLHRYRLGIAEGVIDMPPGKCFPLEANCDILNGVSFHKGCYIGQELTARVHHTGMIRKRHMPVRLMAPLASDISPLTVLNESGANCGSILGTIADRALGLLRIENVLKAKELLVNGSPCETEKPLWWPQDLNAKVSLRKDI